MARLMNHAMFNYRGKKCFVAHCRMSKSVVYDISAPRFIRTGTESWRCTLTVANIYDKGTVIYYTTDGSEPDIKTSPCFEKTLVVDKNCVIKSKAVYEDKNFRHVSATTGEFTVSDLKTATPQFIYEPYMPEAYGLFSFQGEENTDE